MTWSIRARLTAWYSAVVVVVLVSGVLVVDVLQQRRMYMHLDEELGRLMSTLQGVMRNEFGEGLSLQAAADEASIEALAPGRALVLTGPDGRLLAMWGEAIERSWRPRAAGRTFETVSIGGNVMRVLSEPVQHREHRYVAAVMAPLANLEAATAELRGTLALSVLVALGVATLGGWLVGRQTLRPLEEMATQAAAMNERTGERLRTPHPDDELGRMARAFNGLLDRLRQALQAQRQFMADASHELRTPVSVVRTTAQVALAPEARSSEDYREMLNVVSEQSARLTHLVDAMFLLSRAEANGLPLMPEPLYLDDILEESARALRVLAQERNVTVATGGDTELLIVGDDRLLRQMVSNVLDNAVRHARTGGTVTATTSRSPSEIAVRITDDGPGVSPEARDRIFHRFARFSQGYAGAGLGLPIARWVAEAHGGTLVLESAGPDGTTFAFALPMPAATAPA